MEYVFTTSETLRLGRDLFLNLHRDRLDQWHHLGIVPMRAVGKGGDREYYLGDAVFVLALAWLAERYRVSVIAPVAKVFAQQVTRILEAGVNGATIASLPRQGIRWLPKSQPEYVVLGSVSGTAAAGLTVSPEQHGMCDFHELFPGNFALDLSARLERLRAKVAKKGWRKQ